MKASYPVHASRKLEKWMPRRACFSLILALALGACSKPASKTAAAETGDVGRRSRDPGRAGRVGRGSPGRFAVLRVHLSGPHHTDGLAASGPRANNGGYLGCGEDAHAGHQRIGCRRTGGVAVDAQGDQRGEEQPALRHRGRWSRSWRGRDTGEIRRALQQDLRGDVRRQHPDTHPLRSFGAPGLAPIRCVWSARMRWCTGRESRSSQRDHVSSLTRKLLSEKWR
jgi:hypothetical protein